MINNRHFKKNAALIITGVLTVAVTAVVVAAPGGLGRNGGIGSPGGAIQEQEMHGNLGSGEMSPFDENGRPELPGGEATTGERPEPPDGEALTGERPELPGGEAPTGERPELSDGEMPRQPMGRDGRDGGMKEIDIDSIKSAVESVEDENVRSNLEALLAGYEDAKTALETAMEDESEDLDSYRKAEMEAMKALMEALEEAGIDARPELPEGVEGEKPDSPEEAEESGSSRIQQGQDDRPIRQAPEITDDGQEKPEIPVSNADKDVENSSESILKRISGWIKSIFSR